MTPTTEPTIDDRLKGIMKLIADYASGWDVGCPEPSEEDIEQAIKALISDQVAKARIDELNKLSLYRESNDKVDVDYIDWQIIENRINTLNGVKN